jgi:hypothetical protein
MIPTTKVTKIERMVKQFTYTTCLLAEGSKYLLFLHTSSTLISYARNTV